jgi:hypothetical protein
VSATFVRNGVLKVKHLELQPGIHEVVVANPDGSASEVLRFQF